MKKILGVLLILVCTLEVQAGIDPDAQLWIQTLMLGQLSRPYKYYFEIQPRLSKDISTLNSVLIRPAIVYPLNEPHSLWLGYAWIPHFEGGRRQESRIWQQFLRETQRERFTWIHRFRLEERFLPSSDLGIRFRYMLRTLYAIDDSQWSVAVWDEILFNFNTVSGGPAAGFDQNRIFLGMNLRSGIFRIEPGYLNNFVNNRGSEDRLNHALYLMFALMV